MTENWLQDSDYVIRELDASGISLQELAKFIGVENYSFLKTIF
jgi:hypothetical protein